MNIGMFPEFTFGEVKRPSTRKIRLRLILCQDRHDRGEFYDNGYQNAETQRHIEAPIWNGAVFVAHGGAFYFYRRSRRKASPKATA